MQCIHKTKAKMLHKRIKCQRFVSPKLAGLIYRARTYVNYCYVAANDIDANRTQCDDYCAYLRLSTPNNMAR